MPYARIEQRRRVKRESAARARARVQAARQIEAVDAPLPIDPAGAVAEWSRERLIVPPGHPLAGQPMTLPEYGIDFLRDALAPDCREALLCVARKNAKSAITAVLLLAHLCGPLRRAGWRAGVASVTKDKARELRDQIEAIAAASGLTVKATRERISTPGGSVDVLSADRSSGHSSGFDLAIVDELGLLTETARPLVASLRSSVSAKAGRFLALTIRGDGPFIPEILKRRGAPGLAVHLYEAPEGCALDDRDAWQAANPGLGSIKAISYMEGEAERVRITPADQASFRAYDLNQRLDPSRELVCQVDDWRACETDDLPPRRGPAVLGYDLGGSASMTAAVAIWPASGRMECWAAFPAEPDLLKRGERDGVGSRYEQMETRGELRTYPGRVTPCGPFLADVAARLDGERVLAAGADRYRQSEALDALDAGRVRWPTVWRGTGAAPGAHGSADVRAFQRAVLSGRIKVRPSLLLRHAISESSIRYDGPGNPALDKRNSKSRIDVLQAAVIAAGLAERQRKPGRARLHVA